MHNDDHKEYNNSQKILEELWFMKKILHVIFLIILISLFYSCDIKDRDIKETTQASITQTESKETTQTSNIQTKTSETYIIEEVQIEELKKVIDHSIINAQVSEYIMHINNESAEILDTMIRSLSNLRRSFF